ncbi:hypothetical protein [Streptomyces sp. KR80]|uniref:hypothetical protein n=1 Tax=Streptomyces sp. KR80 TaxID=3457426 RepID=UPI003FD55E9F
MTIDASSKAPHVTGAVVQLRLLPWLGPEAKPCYLSRDDNGGMLSRLADETEDCQLEEAEKLVAYAVKVLADPQATPQALMLLGCRLADALSDVSRVAVSRGMRLPAPAHLTGPEDEETASL